MLGGDESSASHPTITSRYTFVPSQTGRGGSAGNQTRFLGHIARSPVIPSELSWREDEGVKKEEEGRRKLKRERGEEGGKRRR